MWPEAFFKLYYPKIERKNPPNVINAKEYELKRQNIDN